VKKRSPRWAKMKVSADGAGVASHAGCELLRELAAATGLVGAWDKALIARTLACPFTSPARSWPTWQCRSPTGHIDLGAESAAGPARHLGPVASTPTAWRALDKVSEEHCLCCVRAGPRPGRPPGARGRTRPVS